MTNYRLREITKPLLNALLSMPVVVLSGMRQSGKSTLLQNEPRLKGRRYITLDDFTVLDAAKKDPESLLDFTGPLTIDEAQKCPELLVAIKRMVDAKRTPGKYLLSGSANFSLLKGVTESLAGRSVYYALQPFTRREITQQTKTGPFLVRFIDKPSLPQKTGATLLKADDIATGGMPAIATASIKDPAVWFKGYQQTYLQRDLRELSRVSDLTLFHRLMQLSVLRSGRILNISELARDIKQSSTTTARYLDLMEASFLIRKIPPFLGNRTSRLIKSPKLFFADSGLGCYLAGLSGKEPVTQAPFYGAMLETYVEQNLTSILESHLPDATICYWNIQGRHEVDFIIEIGARCIAIEVKAGSRFHDNDLKGLTTFLSQTPGCIGGILAYNGHEAVKMGERLWAIPLTLLLS